MKKRLSDQLRAAVERSDKTRYRISMETGISQSILSRFVNEGAGLSLANTDKLCECIGVELTTISKQTSTKRAGRNQK